MEFCWFGFFFFNLRGFWVGAPRTRGTRCSGRVSVRTRFRPESFPSGRVPFRISPRPFPVPAERGSSAAAPERCGGRGVGRRGRARAPWGAASALLFPPQDRRQHVATTGVAGRAVRGRGGARGQPRLSGHGAALGRCPGKGRGGQSRAPRSPRSALPTGSALGERVGALSRV